MADVLAPDDAAMRPIRNSDPAPAPWELALLRLIAEQGAIPFDQLTRFLEAEDHQVRSVAGHLTKLGYADYGRFLHDEPHWIWLTYRGCSLSGTSFSFLPPRVGAMSRMRAVNEIRLHITRRAPDARWICGRAVFREQGYRGHRPSAVVEIDGERHAILALLRPKPEELLVSMLESLMRRHHALITFSEPAADRQLTRLTRRNHWPKLVQRPLPQRGAISDDLAS